MARETIAVNVADCPRCHQSHSFSIEVNGIPMTTLTISPSTIDLTLICPNTPNPPNDLTVTIPEMSLWGSYSVGDAGNDDGAV